MDIIFIETPEFIDKFDKIGSDDEMIKLQNELIKNPHKGNIIKGSGGARKIRIGIKSRGKSGGARVVYYYVDLRGEIWFLNFYAKSTKENVTENEKKQLYKFIKEIIQ